LGNASMAELAPSTTPNSGQNPVLPKRAIPSSPLRWFPGLVTLGQYQSSWLRHDLVAGIVMTAMLVPVGIAYSEASGLPGIYRLCAPIVPLLVYAISGPSRILILGPDSSLAPLILGVVA